jgi:pimeloyl-ACP methyl ester carboxylesterase
MNWREYIWHKLLRRPHRLAIRINAGTGQPVVFLHGLASSGVSWEYTASLLDLTRYHVIAVDLLGFGESPQPKWIKYSVEDHAEAVLAVLKRLRVKEPVILVGHSMGSLIASYIAQTHPKTVSQLILYQMPVYSQLPGISRRDFRRKAYLRVYKYAVEHPKVTLNYAKTLGRVASDFAGFSLDARTWQPFEMSLRNTIMEQRSIDGLSALPIKTDIVQGTYDVLVFRRDIQKYFQANPHIRFHKVHDTHRVSKKAAALLVSLISGQT